MQHELHNKASIFELHSLAALNEWLMHWLNDTVKYKGFSDFFYLEISKNLRDANISSLTDIQFYLV